MRRRHILLILATVFAVGQVLYSACWMYAMRQQLTSQLGIDTREVPVAGSSFIEYEIYNIYPGTGAEAIGLRAGDRLIEVNGKRLGRFTYVEEINRRRPGEEVRLLLHRSNGQFQSMTAVLTPQRNVPPQLTLAKEVIRELIRAFPVLFVLIGLAVLFLRVDDSNAWLLALWFGSLTAAASLLDMQWALSGNWRTFAVSYHLLFTNLGAVLAYYFFAVFPVRSPVDRRVPWLKWVLLCGTLAVAAPLALAALWAGDDMPMLRTAAWFNRYINVGRLLALHGYGGYLLAIGSLIATRVEAVTDEARRKTGVILWALLAGIAPWYTLKITADLQGRGTDSFPFWIFSIAVICVLLIPVSFAYAVLKHRVLEIPVLLKRSARYLLVQRGFALVLIVAGNVTWVLVDSFRRIQHPLPAGAMPMGLVAGVMFGSVLVSTGLWAHKRVSRRIDRIFFRSAYDARLILEELAQKTRAATSRNELGALLRQYIGDALHPRSIDLDLGNVPENCAAGGECVIPMENRDGRRIGRIALGPRLSEEPYSGEDLRLLRSAASQATIVLENISLAEDIAARREAERLARQELEIAKEIQARLFPQETPRLKTLECAGACIQARGVGGDYYDFLDFGGGWVGLLLADTVGKGIGSSLLMANLQGAFRSRYAAARDDLEGLLRSVNRLFYDSTLAHQFATLFFACYDDSTHRLRYANCGHTPPFLLRARGAVERLESTTTVLGAFENWDCPIAEIELSPGDTVVIFSDGLNEARNEAGVEFGEERVLRAILPRRCLPIADLLKQLMCVVQQYSGDHQDDDMTVVLARGTNQATL